VPSNAITELIASVHSLRSAASSSRVMSASAPWSRVFGFYL
jgi:hypothetical protein